MLKRTLWSGTSALVVGGLVAGSAAVALSAFGSHWLGQTPYRPALSPPSPHALSARATQSTDLDAELDARHDAAAVRRPDAGAAPILAKATQNSAPEPALVGVENVLLIGLDKHRGVRRGGRTDTLRSR
jgi:hypothetical protein